MKISDLTVEFVAKFLRLEPEEYEPEEIQTKIDAAKAYISGYTGMPVQSDTEDSIDNHEDITHAALVLVQDMHDNRSMYVQQSNKVNQVVASILDMHRTNLLKALQ